MTTIIYKFCPTSSDMTTVYKYCPPHQIATVMLRSPHSVAPDVWLPPVHSLNLNVQHLPGKPVKHD